MKKYAVLLLITGLTLSGCTLLSPSQTTAGNLAYKTINQDGVLATLTYSGGSQWTYNLKSDLPSPCHTLTAEATVAESSPEQVTIKATITAPQADQACAQAITPKEATGTVNASEQAVFGLTVSK